MARLQRRLRTDLAERGRDRTAGSDAAPDAARRELAHGSAPPSPAPPMSFVDRSIDRFIDVLRSTIGTRAFPRAVAVVVGAALIVLAVLLYALAPSGGGGGESNDEGLRSGDTPAGALIAMRTCERGAGGAPESCRATATPGARPISARRT